MTVGIKDVHKLAWMLAACVSRRAAARACSLAMVRRVGLEFVVLCSTVRPLNSTHPEWLRRRRPGVSAGLGVRVGRGAAWEPGRCPAPPNRRARNSASGRPAAT